MAALKAMIIIIDTKLIQWRLIQLRFCNCAMAVVVLVHANYLIKRIGKGDISQVIILGC